jgi:OmpR-family two-component system manganese-sensing response regulator
MAKILYMESELWTAKFVKDWLQREGHRVEVAQTGADGLQLCRNFEFDIIIVDCLLPDLKGIEVCDQYRKMGGMSWVIVLSELTQVDELEEGFDAGADDYMSKPFNVRELSARVRRALRRAGTPVRPELRIGDVVLDVSVRMLRINEQMISLTPKETALLEYLMRHPNKFVSTSKLLAAVWPSGSTASGGTVRTFMRNLRMKLDSAGKFDLIKTVLGSGYTIEVAS